MKSFVLFLLIPQTALSFELISGTTFAIGAAISYYYGGSISEMSSTVSNVAFCKTYLGKLNMYECCGSPWIQDDITGLTNDLKQHLFGQHIVQQIVPASIAASFERRYPTKPLVMSFHGWPGSGKNYVANFIVKNFFKRGLSSSYFHFFSAPLHFPLAKNVALYQEQLRTWISANVSACPHSIFVFDEIEKMPPGVLDGIKPFLDHHENVNGVDYRRAIFIFLSNIGSNLITERYLELWRKHGKTRDQMTLHDFDSVINKGSFNEKGGLHMSDLIDHNLIDHYVPFLPLERIHVEQCIKASLDSYNYRHDQSIIDEVMKVVTFGPSPEALFSNSGCKRLSSKVASIVIHRRMESNEF